MNTSDSRQAADGEYVTATHWGRYDVVVAGGAVQAMSPIADPEPATIGYRPRSYDQLRARVLRPMVRTSYLHDRGGSRSRRGADTFTPVSWELALDLVADELVRARDAFGPSAIYGGSYGWASAGRFHHAQSQIHRFLNVIGGYTASVDNYSFAAMSRIVPHVLGVSSEQHMLGFPAWEEIAEHVDLVVAFGGLSDKNSQVNPGGVHRHFARAGRAACREAGVEFVNISPSRRDLGDPGTDWIALRPNTDVALMLGLAHEIIREGRHDEAFLTSACVGFSEFKAYLEGRADGVVKDAEWAARICDISPSTIRTLASRIWRARTLITVSWSIQRGDHGEQPYWAAIALAAVAGQLGHPHRGVALGFGTHHSPGNRQRKLPIAALAQKVVEVPTTPSIPVARVTDMLLNPGRDVDFDGRRVTYPRIEVVYWCGGNPFHHQQDLNRLAKAWQRPRTVVVHESFWTATARHADIILPATTYLERTDFAFGRFESHLSVMHRVLPPPGEARDDYEIFAGIARRLGVEDVFTEGRTAEEWVRHLYEQSRQSLAEAGMTIPDFDEFWAAGEAEIPIVDGGVPEHPLSLLREDPEKNPLPTPSGKVELFSETIASFGYADCPGHPAWLEPEEWLGSSKARTYSLHMLSPQPKTRLHSQYDHADHSVLAKVAGREPVLINPEDASVRGIQDGDVVRIFNARGQCLAGAIVSLDVRRGVVILPTGAWYDPVAPGGLDRHGNPNVLTLDKGTSRLAQAPSSGTVLVEVEKYTEPAPPVRAFDPPETVEIA
jgi:biotin/methionine sulfoxide reductase